MENKNVIAIDPGLSGAIVLYRPKSHAIECWRDFKDVLEIPVALNIAYHRSGPAAEKIDTVIEYVHAMPGQGVTSMFSFGHATGVAKGALKMLALRSAGYMDLNVPTYQVAPQTWQTWIKKHFSVPTPAAVEVLKKPDFEDFDSRVYAAGFFVEQMECFTRVKDHNTADAALMAVWAYWHGHEQELFNFLASRDYNLP